ncbi:hypothetical protein D3C79_761730 [compost metagenome]
MAAGSGTLDHLGHQRLDQRPAVRVGHQRRGAGAKQHRKPVIRHVPHQLLPTRLAQVIHGLGIDARRLEQPRPLLNQRGTAIAGRPAVIAKIDRPQRLMTNHPRRLAVDTNETQAAEQVHVIAQGRTQLCLYTQAVLQQYHPRIGRGGLDDQRRQLLVTGGLGPHQQPVALRHVGSADISLNLHLQGAMHCAFKHQPLVAHHFILTAQQEMHIETGPCQHQPIKAADSTTADDADTWFARMHANLQVNVSGLFYTGSCPLRTPIAPQHRQRRENPWVDGVKPIVAPPCNALRFGSPLRTFLLLGRTGIAGGRHP